MRIAIYHNLHSGGAKRVVAEQSRRLAARHHVHLFSLSSADLAFADEAHTAASGGAVTIQRFSPLPMARSPLGRINPLLGLLNVARLDALARRTAALIDRQGFDVVLVHPCQVTQAPLLLRWLRTPALYYCHELPRRLYEPEVPRPYKVRGRLRRALDRVDPLQPGCEVLLRRLDRLSARRAARIATNSTYTRDNIVAAYGTLADVCYQGVDATRFRPVPYGGREPFVLSVGALTPAKGFDFIIEVVGTLPATERPALVLVSNYQVPEERRFLTELARQRGVTLDCRVGVSEVELQSLYARAGCVAYAPVREPFGLVALEAMAAGAPLIGVAEGGVIETIVPGTSGLLAPREALAFGHRLSEVLGSPESASQLGDRARQHILAYWTWEKHITQLELLLSSIARRPAFAPRLGRGRRTAGTADH